MEFGTTHDGESVQLFTLTNASGMTVRLIDLGATLAGWDVPDCDGNLADIVLGFDNVADYQSPKNQHFGCTTGRYANRIAKGRFTLDGTKHQLAINNGHNHLHGGSQRGIDKVVWEAEEISAPSGQQDQGVRFRYTSPAGEENFPGTLDVEVTYFLNDAGELRIDYLATTDEPTIINLTNHTYFNLAGAGTDSIGHYSLQINADHYTPSDETLIPTGEIAPVEGTPLDFRTHFTIGERIDQLANTAAKGYDHNFVLNKPNEGGLTQAAELHDPQSGRKLTVFTTEPAVQFYTANSLFGQIGKQGKAYSARGAFCLETQHFPDSPNHPHFPSVILRPGDEYTQTCIYAVSS